MYPILIFCLVTTALALICGANITRRCTRLSWIPNSLLSAVCTDDHGIQMSTSIDLNDCIGFDTSQRRLICGHSYTATCRDCMLNPNTHLVCCDCGDGTPNSGLNCVNFNQCVADNYGEMVCIPPIYD